MIDVGILINHIRLCILHMHIIGYCMFKIIASWSLDEISFTVNDGDDVIDFKSIC